MPVLKRLSLIALLNSFFFLPAILLTWPLAATLNTHLPEGTDSLVHYWNAWWVGEALSSGESPYFTDMLFAPQGISLVYHNFAWIHIALGLVVGLLLPPIAAYNVVLLINLAVCGICSSALIRRLLNRWDAALIGGLIYMAWPYRLTQPDHPNLHSSWPIPLFFITLIRLFEKRRWQDGVWCGLAFALIGYMRWQMLIPATFMGAVYAIFYLVQEGRLVGWRTVRRQLVLLGAGAGIAILCLAPAIGLLVRESASNPAQLVPAGEAVSMQTDLLAYVTPAPWHSVWGAFSTGLYENFYPNRGSRAVYSPFIGYSVLVLIAVGIFFSDQRDRFAWMAMGLLLISFALGPILLINGRQFPSFPTVYRLFDLSPILRLLREPDRFNMFLGLPTAVLAAYGVATAILKLSNRFNQNTPKSEDRSRTLSPVSIPIALLVLLEYTLIPLPLQPLELPSFYSELADGSGAILDIPLDPFSSKPYMLAQAVHGRPIAQGHASRYPNGSFAFLENDPDLAEILAFDGQPPQQEAIGQMIGRWQNEGFDFLVLHKSEIPSNYLDRWRGMLPFTPRFENDQLLVYLLDLTQIDISQRPAPMAGLIPAHQAQSATCLNEAGVLGVDVTWVVDPSAPSQAEPKDLKALLSLSNGDVIWTSELMPLTDLDEAGRIFSGSYETDLPADLPLETYEFAILLDRDDQFDLSDVEGHSLEKVVIQTQGCDYDIPDKYLPINARLGDTARLIGYETSVNGAQLELDLLWRPEQRTGVDYTVFVHFFDLETGLPLAQYDAMPRSWTYPTSRWGLDEQIDEQIVLDLGQIPPGKYGLGVGLYNAATGERLPIVAYSPDGERVKIDDRRLLLEIVDYR
ncbi:MAG: hypothetical protein AAF633_01785 [Chloroflexota bacterium]